MAANHNLAGLSLQQLQDQYAPAMVRTPAEVKALAKRYVVRRYVDGVYDREAMLELLDILGLAE
jgi:hypothetical protein